jgi:hypothetical protein
MKIKDGIIWVLILTSVVACEEFVNVDPPRTQLVKSTVFTSDATALAAVADMYIQLASATSFASGNYTSISFVMSINADEQLNFYVGTPVSTMEYQQLADNVILPNNSRVSTFWSQPYQVIYKANSIIEGVAQSSGMSENIEMQVEGEARFLRAFCFFYLVNIFGDVPLITTTDYKTNASMKRTPADEVYATIIEDLLRAKELLPNDYAISDNERVRVNKGAATALLSRAYLYKSDWANAEVQATEVIDNAEHYMLNSDISLVFRAANNKESIWQLWRNTTPMDRATFFLPVSGPNYGVLRAEFLNDFEDIDQRKSWIESRTINGIEYFYAYKYAAFGTSPPLDYSTVLRLAEQFLIRAEARTQLNKVAEAQQDINVIRHRAGLLDTPAADKDALLLAIELERKHELFTEWGHRWFDLKRTGRVDEVLSSRKPQWTPTAALYPIPEIQLLNNPNMKNQQNPGY